MNLLKHSSSLYLRLSVLFMGLMALAICVFGIPVIAKDVEESMEIKYASLFIMSLMYFATVGFLVCLYQALRLLSYIDKNKAFSQQSVNSLKNIKYCAIYIALVLAPLMPIVYLVADKDDAPGLILIAATIFLFAPSVVAIFAAVLQRLFQDAITIKSENELTV